MIKEIIKFGAEWCAPCTAQHTILEKFKSLHPEIPVTELDADDEVNDQLLDKYGVRGLPALVYIDEAGDFILKAGLQQVKDIEANCGL